MKQHFQVATLIVAAALAAAAQTSNSRVYRSGNEWVQEINGTLPAAKMIRVKTSGGSIHVQGVQQNTINYTVRERVRAGSEEAARREFSNMKFTVSNSADAALLRAECEGYRHGSIDFDVQAPAQTSMIRMETDGGSVAAQNINGKVAANTGGGSIHVDQIGDAVYAESGGGSIDIGKVGGAVHVETGGGSIRIGSAGGEVVASSGGGTLMIGSGKAMKLETGGGSIQVVKCDGRMSAETGGGSIELGEIIGPADVETGGGSIRVGPISGGVRAETGSGPIIATLAQGEGFTPSRLETSAGDITVYVPAGLKVTIRAQVEVGRGDGIRASDFPEIKITKSNETYGPREMFAEGNLNGGGPLLKVHTTTGTIEFKRK